MNSRTIQRLRDVNNAQELWDAEDWLFLISLRCDQQIQEAYMRPPTPSAPLTIVSLPYLLRGETPPSADGERTESLWPAVRKYLDSYYPTV